MIEDNREVAAAVAPLTKPAAEFFQVSIGGGVTLDGWMMKPTSFDPLEEVSRSSCTCTASRPESRPSSLEGQTATSSTAR